MDYRRWSRRAEWAVVAAVVLLHLAIFLAPERQGNSEFLVRTAHDAQLLGAIVLVMGWAVLGPGRLWIRVTALPVLLVLWLLPWNTRMMPRETSGGFLFALIVSATLVIVLLRTCGLRVALVERLAEKERRAQFTLLALILATTLIAVTFGLLEWLRPTLSAAREFDPADWIATYRLGRWTLERRLLTLEVRQIVIASAAATAALGGVWAVLRPGATWFRLAALCMALPALGIYLTHVAGVSRDEFSRIAIDLAAGLAPVATLTAITVLPLRLFGYRMLRPAAKAAGSKGRAAGLCRAGLAAKHAPAIMETTP